jgi:hypothetical protein
MVCACKILRRKVQIGFVGHKARVLAGGKVSKTHQKGRVEERICQIVDGRVTQGGGRYVEQADN